MHNNSIIKQSHCSDVHAMMSNFEIERAKVTDTARQTAEMLKK